MGTANRKLKIKGTDDGIWRRIVIVPWTYQIPESEVDERIGEKFREELSGILAWAVRGCLAWQRRGLKTDCPECIRNATKEYRQQSDIVLSFLSNECAVCPEADTPRTRTRQIHDAYKTWLRENDIQEKDAPSIQALRPALELRGIRCRRSSEAEYYCGLRLLSPDEKSRRREEQLLLGTA